MDRQLIVGNGQLREVCCEQMKNALIAFEPQLAAREVVYNARLMHCPVRR